MSGTRLLRHLIMRRLIAAHLNVEFAVGHDQSNMLGALPQEPGLKSGRAPSGQAGVNQTARFAASWPLRAFILAPSAAACALRLLK